MQGKIGECREKLVDVGGNRWMQGKQVDKEKRVYRGGNSGYRGKQCMQETTGGYKENR